MKKYIYFFSCSDRIMYFSSYDSQHISLNEQNYILAQIFVKTTTKVMIEDRQKHVACSNQLMGSNHHLFLIFGSPVALQIKKYQYKMCTKRPHTTNELKHKHGQYNKWTSVSISYNYSSARYSYFIDNYLSLVRVL